MTLTFIVHLCLSFYLCTTICIQVFVSDVDICKVVSMLHSSQSEKLDSVVWHDIGNLADFFLSLQPMLYKNKEI